MCDFTLKNKDDVVTVTEKRINGINKASKERGLSFRLETRKQSILNVEIISPIHIYIQLKINMTGGKQNPIDPNRP